MKHALSNKINIKLRNRFTLKQRAKVKEANVL